MRSAAVWSLLLISSLSAACGEENPLPPTTPPPPPPRTYLMGWAPGAPRPDESLIIALIDSIAAVSEVMILQQEAPWVSLLAGASMDSLLEDPGVLADFLRAKGADIVFLVDPLDGLDRTSEPPDLVAAGRTLLEPEIRQMHEDWVLAIAERIRPEWFGLASEINTLAEGGNPLLYAELVDLVNTLAPQIRARVPGTQVFVSFQADQANGAVEQNTIDHFALIDDFDIDALGLSSYPVFFFPTPADVPNDFFEVFDQATALPLIYVEGGWSSEDLPGKASTPQQQLDWFRRYEALLDGVDAEMWVMLTFTDIDIASLGLPPDRAQTLSNFAFMGILDLNLARKPAYSVWEEVFARPYRP